MSLSRRPTPRISTTSSSSTSISTSIASGLALLLLGAAVATARQTNAPEGGPAPFPLPPGLTNGAVETQEIILSNLVSQAVELLAPEAAPEPGAAGVSNAPPDLAPAGTNTGGNQPYNGRESRRRRFDEERAAQSQKTGAGNPAGTSADTNAGPAKLTYDEFRTIVDLNIFDPNRRPRRIGPREDLVQPPASEYLTFVGTMTYEKGTFAFFDGSSIRFRKALKLADTIAGHKLTAITDDAVKLALGTNQFEMRMGMRLSRQDEDSAWRLSRAPAMLVAEAAPPSVSGPFEFTSRTPDAAAAPSASSTTSSAGASSASLDEIRKKMMQRREQE